MAEPNRYDWFNRLMLILAGMLGAGGVAAAAAASHTGDERLFGPLALIALTHAPAVLAIGLATEMAPMLRTGGLTLAAGAGLFSLDLAIRHFLGSGPFPLVAPLGGILMIAGWAVVILSGGLGRRG